MTITRNIFMGREMTNRLGLMKVKKMDAISSQILDSVVTIEGIRSPRQLVGSLSAPPKRCSPTSANSRPRACRAFW